MAISKVNNFTPVQSFCVPPIDEEEKRIMAKLLEYGETPTGNKTVDKAKLRNIELKKAKLEPCVSNKFITVSIAEQERIQEKKKEKREIDNPKDPIFEASDFKGAKAMGEQLYLAIQLKKKEEDKFKKKKLDE